MKTNWAKVVGDLLIACAGGQPDASVIALDRMTGDVRWNKLSDRPAYSAPIVIRAGGIDQLVVWTGDSITGFDRRQLRYSGKCRGRRYLIPQQSNSGQRRNRRCGPIMDFD